MLESTGLHCVNVLYESILSHFKSADVTILRSEFIKTIIQFIMQMSKAADLTPNVLYVLNGLLPCPEWGHFVNQDELESIPTLRGKNVNSWISNDTPELVQTSDLTSFQQLVVITKKRPDRFFQAARGYISKVVPKLNESRGLESLLEFESPASPILLLLSEGGIDPTTEIEELATRKERHLDQVALEENNDSVIEKLKEAISEGNWLLLKNCHLGTRWLATIESYFDGELHPNFRLWLTAEPNPNFSSSILRRSLKFSIEAPLGLGRAMQRISASSWSESMSVTPQTLQLSLLHAIVEERVNYSGIGWTKGYDFNASDLRVALRQKQPSLLKRIVCDVIYGARLDNPIDFALLEELAGLVLSDNGPGMAKLLDYPNGKITRKEADAYISKLPISQTGLPLGLAKNSDQALAESKFDSTMETIGLLDRRQKANKDDWANLVDQMKSAFVSQLGSQVLEQIEKFTDSVKPVDDPVEAFFVGEQRFGHKIYSMISRHLKQLKHAMRHGLSSEVKDITEKLLLNQVPDKWERIYDSGPAKPVDYIQHVGKCLRYVFAGSSSRTTIDITSLFRPSALIVSLEQKLWSGSPTQDVMMKLSSQGKIKLDGLYLSGGDYDTRVKEARSETPTIVKLPALGVSFVEADSVTTTLPLYKTKERAANVAKVSLSGLDIGSRVWVLNGTALFLSSN